MYFSQEEKARRLGLLENVMRKQDLAAMALVWGNGPAIRNNEEFYLLQSDHLPAGNSIVLLFGDREPLIITNHLHAFSNERQGVDYEQRILAEGENPGVVIADALAERGISSGRVGWRWSSIPAWWYVPLDARLPKVEWVDLAATFGDLWYVKSKEEADAALRSAEIADAGYEFLLGIIEPGMTEFDVASEFENFAIRNGANRNFTLAASGRLAPGSAFPRLASPSRRILEPGDSIMMELTPAVSGYYTQIVRTIHLGDANHYADELRAVTVSAIDAATDRLRPGVTMGELGHVIAEDASRAGYQALPTLGHTVGVDLIYEALVPESDRVLHEHDTIIIHPKIHHANGDYAFFWGETYLVTQSGNVRINQASSKLKCVNRPGSANGSSS